MNNISFDLTGKIALVTGATHGIGMAIAILLASDAGKFINGQVIYVDGGILANFGYVKGENDL